MKQTEICMSMELVRSCIKELKRKYPNWSSTQIANFVGMGRSTFNRLENGTGKPGLDSIIKLLSSSGRIGKVSDIPKMIGDATVADGVAKNLSHNADSAIIEERLAEFFASYGHRMILLLATADEKGIARRHLKEEYGSSGMRMVNELIDIGILTETGDGILKCKGYAGNKEEPQTLGQNTLKDLLVDCIREKYDAGKFGGNENWLSLQTGTVDKEKAMGLIRMEFKKAYERIEEALSSDEFDGNDRIFVGMVTDSLLIGSSQDQNNNINGGVAV